MSAKSVKLLDEQELKDSDAREAWWVEIRQEVASLLCVLLFCMLQHHPLLEHLESGSLSCQGPWVQHGSWLPREHGYL